MNTKQTHHFVQLETGTSIAYSSNDHAEHYYNVSIVGNIKILVQTMEFHYQQ